MTPEEELEQLNEQYVKASLAGDVEWYRRRLAEEFVCIESDGSVLDKAAFLRQTAQGSDLVEYRLDRVDIRVYGEAGVVRPRNASHPATRPRRTPGYPPEPAATPAGPRPAGSVAATPPGGAAR